MLRGLKVLVLKEIKELVRDPKITIGIIIIPLVIFPLMGLMLKTSMGVAQKSVAEASVTIVDLDGEEYSRKLIKAINESTKNAVVLSKVSFEKALEVANESKSSVLVIIPEGFSQNISSGLKGRIEVYGLIRSLSLSETFITKMVESYMSKFRESILLEELSKHGVSDPETMLNPVELSMNTIFKGRVANISPESLSGVLISHSMTPIMLMVILVIAMQVAASSMAIEKEAKTLETLLSLPVSRLMILISKLFGSVFVAILGAASYLVGFTYYVNAFLSIEEISVQQRQLESYVEAVGLVLKPESYIVIGLSIFLSFILALTLAIAVATYADDVRSAQILVGYLYAIIIVPAIMLMFVDLSLLPLPIQIALYAIPFTHSILIIKAVFLENYLIILLGLTYMLLFTLVTLYLTARVFLSEKILTAKLSIKLPWRK